MKQQDIYAQTSKMRNRVLSVDDEQDTCMLYQIVLQDAASFYLNFFILLCTMTTIVDYGGKFVTEKLIMNYNAIWLRS
jgi:hypothetical protein